MSKAAFSQDTFTYKTLKATNVTENTVQLEGAPQQTQSFTSKSINLSSAAMAGGTVNGSTVGNLSVSPTGGVTYSVPIDVPPGLNGIQPDISLHYDSQSGNGLAGWGWNVSGVSVITRIPSTKFHDDMIDPVDFDLDDRFSFDGQRLILKTGTYGGDGAEYQTESYSNVKITSHGTHPTSGVSGPSYFKVYYPDGSIAYYGNSSNSVTRMDYAITYWENPQGIRINYLYHTTPGFRIDKITYGTRGTVTSINEIDFVYVTRERDEKSYSNGAGFTRNKILKEIKVYGKGGTPYRNYVIQHDNTSLDYERVTSIQEKTGDNSLSRSAISFTYGNTTSSITNVDRAGLTVQNIEQRNAKVVSLDISGDGKMDFLVYPTTGTDAKKKFWLFDDIQDAGNLNFGDEVNTGLFVDIFPVSWLSHTNKLLSGQGLAIIQNNGSNEVKFKVYSGGTVLPVYYQYEKLWNAPTYKPQDYYLYGNSSINRVPLKYLSGDFDGDGLSDVMALERTYSASDCIEYPASSDPNCEHKVTRNGIDYCCYACGTSTHNTAKAHFIRLDRRVTSGFATVAGYLGRELKTTDQLYTMDVNGDGKTDILQFREGKVYVYSLDKNNSLQLLWETTNANIKMEFPILPGDYNGDGKTDFMMPKAENSQIFSLFMSYGNSFVRRDLYNPFDYKETDYNGQGTLYGYNLVPIDINGDGKTDIIDYRTTTYNNNSNGTQTVSIYQNSKPINAYDDPEFSSAGSTTKTGNLKHFPIPIFLSSNAPNHNLDFASISDNHVTSFVFTKDHREDVTLEQVTNNGVTTTIKYDQVNPYFEGDGDPNYYSAYTPSYTQTYPFVNVNVAPSFKVVRELEQAGVGLTRKQQFYYEGAVSHTSGLGFVGFEVLKRSNWYGDDVGALWSISKHDPMLRGAVTEQIVANTFSSNPASYMSKVNYFYDYKLIANPGSPSAPQITENITRNSLLPGTQTDEVEVSITLQPGFHAIGSNGDYWGYIFPPEEQPGDTGYAGAVDIILERKETDNGLTGVFTTETYTYDQYNNPLVTTTTFTGGSRTMTNQYYNNASATNNTYHVGRLKNVKESVTLNGNTFSTEEQYTYNNNLVTKIKKKGNGTGWLTEDFGHDANGNIITRTLTDGGSITRSESFEYSNTYDERFLTKSIDVEDLETTFVYEAHTGNLQSTIDPLGLTTSYVYDKWGRVTKETDYLSNDTDHTYTTLSGGGLQHSTDYPDGGKEKTIHNAFGWVAQTGTLSLNNQWVYTDYEYYLDGKIKRESEPHDSSPSQWNTYNYDVYGRPTTQTLYTGRTISYSYSNPGLSYTVDDGVKVVTTTLDALGNTVKVVDPGGTIDYTYFANGTMKTADYGGNVVTVGIDGWGRKVSLNDPSAGSYSYTYNNVGELLTETTPKGTTTYDYDEPTGRLLTKEIKGDNTDLFLTYKYEDPDGKRLTKIEGDDFTGSGRTYLYEYIYETGAYKRLKTVKENTGLANFEYQMTYDAYGRVEKETQISNLVGGASKTVVTKNVYDTSGLLKEIWNDSGIPEKLWELNNINARGQALTITLGNGMVQNKTYDAYGYLTKIEDKETGTSPMVALHTEYDFNAQRGTLNSRENFGFNWQETFGYDNLDRLTTITGSVGHTMSYKGNGNIDVNNALGTYEYGDTGKKYRLTEIDPNTAGETYFQQHPTQQISYNAFKKPVDIHQQGHGRVSFEYGPLMNRSTAYYGGEQSDRTQRRYKKHYSAIIPAEIVEDTQAGTTKIITYVGGDGYTAPIAHIKTTGTGAIDEYHYLHRDYLGSILAITDTNGNVKEERQFGAWGKVDQFLDSASGTTFTHASLLGRGYTGHEHFFEVGLIHMNGRMYDPQLGRFLSPDNFIQDPYNTQNYNRYGYVLNNPLMYTDPSGEIFEPITWITIGIIALASLGINTAINSGWFDGGAAYGPISYANPAPVPSNNVNNSRMTSSASPPREKPKLWSRLSDTWNNFNKKVTQFQIGNFVGHKMFLDNTINGITKGIPALMDSSLLANAYIINGEFEAGFDIHFGNGYSILEGILTPIDQGIRGTNQLLDGNYFEAGVNLSQTSDAVALALLSEGAGSGASTISRGLVRLRRFPFKRGKYHFHHSDPMFMGGLKNQRLTRMRALRHQKLHKEMNAFLRQQTDGFGNHMRPQRGNSGQRIRLNFDRQQRLDALSRFYRTKRYKYPRAVRDFYKQHPNLR
jgi:RHS repeat-associated protein